MGGMELVEFLRERLDEDEAAARASAGAPWVTLEGVGASQVLVDPVAIREEKWRFGKLGHVASVEHHEYAAHIARHDPARVLADVEAKRRIVDWHESWPVLVNHEPVMKFTESGENLAVSMSQRMAWLTTQEYRARFGDEPPTSPILRLLVLPYAQHPDYDPAWNPDEA